MAKTLEKEPYIKKAIDRLQKRKFSDIKSILDSFDDPKSFKQVSNDTTLTPDITATSIGKKYYFDIAFKTDAEGNAVNKWKLLSTLAGRKGGKLYLYAPHGHKSSVQKLVAKNEIEANVLAI